MIAFSAGVKVWIAGGGTDMDKLVGERHPHFVTTLRKPIIAAVNGEAEVRVALA